MTEIKYARNWCDYFTPCPHNKDIMVGSFECSRCEYHKGFVEESQRFNKDKTDYSKYFTLINGFVKCGKE